MLTAIILTACILSGLGSLIALGVIISHRKYLREVNTAHPIKSSFHVGAR